MRRSLFPSLFVGLLERHFDRTGSPRAREILDGWEQHLPRFWRVAPVEQVAVLEAANEGVTEGEEVAEKA